jgi:hypothetical protein
MKKYFWFLILLSAFSFPILSHADFTRKVHSPEEFATAVARNQRYRFGRLEVPAKSGQPVLETDRFQYLLMNGTDFGIDNLLQMQKTFSQNLPKDMILVVVTEDKLVDQVKEKFLQWISANQLIVASGNNLGDTLWARDSYPYPVYMDESKSIELVAHQYFRFFDAEQVIADAVSAIAMISPSLVAVGGNIMATEKGECLVVDSQRAFGLTDKEYMGSFRCKSVVHFPWLAGIGDVDEVIKVLPNGIMLTNQPTYVNTLQSLGYDVVMLPKSLTGAYRTYANSVIINNTVFMPVFGDPQDQMAENVYESFGYKVIGIESDYLSDEMMGSLHCLTMTYPAMDPSRLLKSLGLKSH